MKISMFGISIDCDASYGQGHIFSSFLTGNGRKWCLTINGLDGRQLTAREARYELACLVGSPSNRRELIARLEERLAYQER